MKKLFFFATLTLVLAGFGMQTGTVHAQTLTTNAAPISNTALEQELQVAKATLVNLEMQQGMIPAGEGQITTGATAAGLTPTEVDYFTGLLSRLTSSLSQLEATVAANPNMNATQVASISSTLGGMKGTLLAMTTQIAQDENGSPIAMTSPAATTAAPSRVARTAPVKTLATISAPAATTAAATSTNTVQATAQASSIWSFTKTNWPVIVIILLVIAILAILFWPENEAKAPSKTAPPSSAPSAPKIAATATTGTGTNIAATSANTTPNTNAKQTA
jgi:hypothetical protein